MHIHNAQNYQQIMLCTHHLSYIAFAQKYAEVRIAHRDVNLPIDFAILSYKYIQVTTAVFIHKDLHATSTPLIGQYTKYYPPFLFIYKAVYMVANPSLSCTFGL